MPKYTADINLKADSVEELNHALAEVKEHILEKLQQERKKEEVTFSQVGKNYFLSFKKQSTTCRK